MSRLQQCIDALEASRDNICCCGGKEGRCVAHEHYNDAIAMISSILSAKPSGGEIEAVAKCLAEYHGGDWKFILKIYRSGEDTGAYHRFIKMAKAALLTAFPQQETNNSQQKILYNALMKLNGRFVATMKWSKDATEHEKTLVTCNLNGFCGFLSRTMPEEASLPQGSDGQGEV